VAKALPVQTTLDEFILVHERALAALATVDLDGVEAVLQAERVHVTIHSGEAGIDGG
jgi:hypothetical protein